MSWHLTWQDPVALTLAVAGIWAARVLARRLRAHAAPCQKCAAASAEAAPAAPTVVRLDQLRMGRPPRARG